MFKKCILHVVELAGTGVLHQNSSMDLAYGLHREMVCAWM